MITKCDKFDASDDGIDSVQQRLAIATNSFSSPVTVTRVSVIGKRIGEGDDPPPQSEREVDQLLRACIWSLVEAIRANRSIAPPVRPDDQRPPDPALKDVKPIPETRAVASAPRPSDSVALLELAEVGGRPRVVTMSVNGAIAEVGLAIKSGNLHFSDQVPVASVEEPPEDIDEFAFARLAQDLVGGVARGATCLWIGKLGGPLRRRELPATFASWVALAPHQILGADDRGRCHYLIESGGKWTAETLQDVVPPSPNIVCTMASPGTVLVSNGAETRSLTIDTKAREIKERGMGPLKVAMDTPDYCMNGHAVFAGRRKDGGFVVGKGQKAHATAPALDGGLSTFALAKGADVAMFVATDRRLRAVRPIDARVVVTDPAQSFLVPGDSSPALVMSANGRLALVDDGAVWHLVRILGL
jgi:hypothetical protein